MKVLALTIGAAPPSKMQCRHFRVEYRSSLPVAADSPKAKWYHLSRLLDAHLTERHDAAWFLDEDMRPASFDCDRFFSAWNLTRSVIAQPTIAERRLGRIFRHDEWVRGEIASWRSTRYVEQQAPLINATFLRWFMRLPITAHVLRLEKKWNVDFGVDSMWCAAARARYPSASACAVIHVPMQHADLHTQKYRLGDYFRRGFALLEEAGMRRPLPCWHPRNCTLHPWFFLPHKASKRLVAT